MHGGFDTLEQEIEEEHCRLKYNSMLRHLDSSLMGLNGLDWLNQHELFYTNMAS